MKTTTDFIVIDDEPMNNRICEIVIMRVFPESDLKSFTDPEKGFDHVASTYNLSDANNVIVFLDINMPVINGWQVLDKIQALPADARKRINIYILSSSTDYSDIKRADEHQLVKKFIRKPLLINTLRQEISGADFL